MIDEDLEQYKSDVVGISEDFKVVKKKVPMKSSAQKGGAYERELAKKLSLWISAGVRDDLLWRSVGSGGHWTKISKKAQLVKETQSESTFKDHAGDLTYIHKDGKPFIDAVGIESKRRNNPQTEKFLLNIASKKSLSEWWNTHLGICKNLDRAAMLVSKENLHPAILVTDFHITPNLPYTYVSSSDCYVYLFEDYIKHITYEDFMKALKAARKKKNDRKP